MLFQRRQLARAQSDLDRMTEHGFTFGDAHVRVYEKWDMRSEIADLPDTPTFVLVHGLGVSSRFFVPLSLKLARYGRVLLFDLPGFHDLPKPKRPMSIVDFADVTKRALDELHVVDPILVGHSMGAQTVAELLAVYPGYASAAMLIGPIVVTDERSVRRLMWRFAQSSRHESASNVFAATLSYLRAGLPWIFDVVPKVVGYPIEERLPDVAARTLFVSGEFDRVSPTSWREALASMASDGRVVTIPGAAHGVVHDHHDPLIAELVALAGLGSV